MSYSASPLSEYLGSNIYGILGIPVHKTILGYSLKNKKTLVACKDFLNAGDKLSEFREIKVSSPPLADEEENGSIDGNGTVLEEVLSVIRNDNLMSSVPDAQKRFWEMFLVDAYIGNHDRNNGNWGVIRHLDGTNSLSPVYDNGGCLNNKWDDRKFRSVLGDKERMADTAYRATISIFKTIKNGKEHFINPFQLMKSERYPLLNSCAKHYADIIRRKEEEIFALIDNIPSEIEGINVISDVKREFYHGLLKERGEAIASLFS